MFKRFNARDTPGDTPLEIRATNLMFQREFAHSVGRTLAGRLAEAESGRIEREREATF